MAFRKATKMESRLRLAISGPSGSGKTYTGLTLAKGLGGRVAVIDTERGSASKYADIFDFDVLELESFHPQQYIEAIHEAEKAGYDVLVIDSLTHAWSGKDGALELVDKVAKRTQSGNSFAAWREVTPIHNQLVDTMVQSRCHLIVTMRSKVDYVIETNSQGKQQPRRVGMAPIQREGMEYEFDVFAEMTHENTLIIQKSRCSALSGAVIEKPSVDVAEVLKGWLVGAPAPETPLKVMPKHETVPPPEAGAPGITDGQRKRLFAISNSKRIGTVDLHRFLAEVYQLSSVNDISQDQYEVICTALEDGSVTDFLKMKPAQGHAA